MNRPASQSGSAIVLILIAVAMFAALSYAVFQGGRLSGTQLASDQARLAAQEIIAYGDALAKTVQTLKLRGCADTQYNFANTLWTLSGVPIHGVGHNPSAVSGCGAFVTGEGNMQVKTFSQSYFDAASAGGADLGSSRIGLMPLMGIGTADSLDMVLTVPRLKKEVCLSINKILGVDDVNGNPPEYTLTTYFDYAGVVSGTYAANADVNGKLSGKTAFCALGTAGNYKFNRVLIAR